MYYPKRSNKWILRGSYGVAKSGRSTARWYVTLSWREIMGIRSYLQGTFNMLLAMLDNPQREQGELLLIACILIYYGFVKFLNILIFRNKSNIAEKNHPIIICFNEMIYYTYGYFGTPSYHKLGHYNC